MYQNFIMEKEELAFSSLQLTYSVIYLLGIYYFFSNDTYLFAVSHNPIILIVVIGLIVYMIKSLRMGFFILTRKPAVILTNEKVVITATNDTIKWADVADIYMTYRVLGFGDSVRLHYITIKLHDSEAYLRSIKNPIIRKYRWITRNWKPSPVEIKLSLVRGDEDDNYRSVLRFYQNNRGF